MSHISRILCWKPNFGSQVLCSIYTDQVPYNISDVSLINGSLKMSAIWFPPYRFFFLLTLAAEVLMIVTDHHTPFFKGEVHLRIILQQDVEIGNMSYRFHQTNMCTDPHH